MNEHLKELLKELLTDNLEVRINKDQDRGLVVELFLFEEVISSDFIHIF